MIDFKDCPRCKKHTMCIGLDGTPEIAENNVIIDTEYVCRECRAVFNERIHYSIKYEYTETVLQIDENNEEDE